MCGLINMFSVCMIWLGFAVALNLLLGLIRVHFLKDNYEEFYQDGPSEPWTTWVVIAAHVFWPIYAFVICCRVFKKAVSPVISGFITTYKMVFSANYKRNDRLKKLEDEIEQLKSERNS